MVACMHPSPRYKSLHIDMPYCLERVADGRYAVLNRRYKPLGESGSAWVDYNARAVSVPGGIDRTLAVKLSHNRNGDIDRIYLYDDKSDPALSDRNMAAYQRRVRGLSKLNIRILILIDEHRRLPTAGRENPSLYPRSS
jgi:hypothetical protein